jgi:hypothetical protein
MGLKMEHGRETQDPHEPDNLFIYKQLKLIQFWYNPLRMSYTTLALWWRMFPRDRHLALVEMEPLE